MRCQSIGFDGPDWYDASVDPTQTFGLGEFVAYCRHELHAQTDAEERHAALEHLV